MAHHLSHIPVQLPYKEIYRRMKYNIHKTGIGEQQKLKIDSIIEQGFLMCESSGLWDIVDITENNNSIVFNDSFSAHSDKLGRLLANSKSALFMAVTCGKTITDAIAAKLSEQKTTEALIFDAVAGETADAAMDWLQKFVTQQLLRNGQSVTKKRYSPGYGDLSLKFQTDIDRILHLDTIGVIVNERFILQPEKSVTAIAGII